MISVNIINTKRLFSRVIKAERDHLIFDWFLCSLKTLHLFANICHRFDIEPIIN